MAVKGETEVPPSIYQAALVPSQFLGRILRLDPPGWQGVATSWFAKSAFRDGDYATAVEYARYERAEYRRLAETVLGGWVSDLLEYAGSASWGGSSISTATGILKEQTWQRLEQLAELALGDAIAGAEAPNEALFLSGLRQLRDAQLTSNDLAVRLVQDLLTLIQDHEGDAGVLAAMEVSYQRIWRPRYDAWFRLPGHERLALSAEGMRAHYGGPGRYGDFLVEERSDGYLMRFVPCGTGQILRRGDGDRESNSYLAPGARGKTRDAYPWSKDMAGMPLYCAHCPILLEHLPQRDFGVILRPVLYEPNADLPCSWFVPKGELRSGDSVAQ
jgi:hypothetical protein